jgi:hypothetical protein
MKKLFLPLILLALLAGISCQENIDIEKEKEAIKAVIEEARAAYLAGDLSRIQALWVQDENSRMVYMDDDGYVEYVGWDEIANSVMDLKHWDEFENYDNKDSNLVINVYENTALALYHNVWSGVDKEEEAEDILLVIVLVNLEDKWDECKIDVIAALKRRVAPARYGSDEDEDDEEDEGEEGEEGEEG